jgi:hypothetical protein
LQDFTPGFAREKNKVGISTPYKFFAGRKNLARQMQYPRHPAKPG